MADLANLHAGEYPKLAFGPGIPKVVTASDTDNIYGVALLIKTDGAVALEVEDGVGGWTTETIPTGTLAVGIYHPMRFRKLMATNTTASGFVILR